MPYINEASSRREAVLRLTSSMRRQCALACRWGPIELADVVGLDVSLHVGRVLAEAFRRPIAAILQKLVDEKKLGRKSGAGFYHWQDGKAVARGFRRATVPADLEDRLILPLLNEAVACLREGMSRGRRFA